MPPSNPAPKKRHSKMTWIWITVCILVLFSPVIAFTAYRIHNKITWEGKMESYLQNKYKQKFNVTNFRREGGGIGMPGQGTADAYATDNNEMKFEVGETGNSSPERKYYDTYIKTLWSLEARINAEQAVKDIFNGNAPWLNVEVYPYNTTTGREDRSSNLYNNLPTLKTQYAKDRSALAYSLHVRTSGTFDATDRAKHIARVDELVKYVASEQTGKGIIRYTVNIDNENSMYTCNLSENPLTYPIEPVKLENCFTKINMREE